ncbi:4'-phosphopantetheinyl transferase superfamily protein [Streptomyces sp. TG1A-60]|uniref:4'-phosphopantetheinyl transferase family protein n=1 Tax=Streptomyces sp. TG1A-60 TaxID=3129111 RepID=UPI0030D590D0
MSAVMASSARAPAPGLDESVILDPSRPLRISHARGPLTIAVVSIAWLRERDDAVRSMIEARHLSRDEIAQAAELRIRKRRLEWLAGRLAIKHSVYAYQQRHVGVSPCTRGIEVSVVPDGIRAGKPTVNAPVEVGLSHSSDFAVAACGPRALGIDIERSRQVPPMLAELLTLAPETAQDPRLRSVDAMPLSLRWACKEAVLKHFGFGLRVDTREVELIRWRPDGRFSWHAGPGLRRHVPWADDTRFDSWAREVSGYSMALVWQ